MTNILTAEEQAFLEKMEQQRQRHKESQAKYRERNKDKMNEYNKIYQENQRIKRNEIKKKLMQSTEENLPPPAPIDIEEIRKKEKINKRTREGKKKASQPEIKPNFETRKEPLGKRQ